MAMRFSFLRLLLGAGLLFSSAAHAQGISIDGDSLDFGLDEPAESTPNVCWVAPKRLRRADGKRLRKALYASFEGTRPSYATHALKPVRSPKRQGRKLGCQYYVKLDVRGRSRARITMTLMDRRYKRRLKRVTARASMRKLKTADLEPAWKELWPRIAGSAPAVAAAPAPPVEDKPVEDKPTENKPVEDKPSDLPVAAKSPAPPASKPGSFVDQELISAQSEAKEEAREEEAKAAYKAPPVAGILAGLGYTSRSLSDVPSLREDSFGMLSIWAELQLYLGPLLFVPGHDLNVEAGYALRFASVKNEAGASSSVTTDRFQFTARYHYPIASALRLGVLAGYEYLRFDVPSGYGAFGSRFSTARAGLSAVLPVMAVGEEGSLDVTLEGAGRVPFGSDEVNFGFDARAGLALRLDGGFLTALRVRYLSQPGTTLGFDFSEQQIDLELGAGWSF